MTIRVVCMSFHKFKESPGRSLTVHGFKTFNINGAFYDMSEDKDKRCLSVHERTSCWAQVTKAFRFRFLTMANSPSYFHRIFQELTVSWRSSVILKTLFHLELLGCYELLCDKLNGLSTGCIFSRAR